MTRSVALRAFSFFVTIAALVASIGMASYVPLAEVLFLITAAMCVVLLVFGFAVPPAQSLVPVRIRRRRF